MKRKRICVLSAAAALTWLLTLGAAAAEVRELPFSDVPADSWCCDVVRYVYEKGWMVGTDRGEFQPDGPLTRGAFVTVLGRVAGACPEDGPRLMFRDVSAEAYYEPYVRWAAEEGLVSGYTDGSFGPDQPMTRQDMAVILARYLTRLGVELPAGETAAFADMEQVSDYAKAGVELARTAGLVHAGDDGNFYPERNVTRAEAAEAFYQLDRALEQVPGETSGGAWVDAGDWAEEPGAPTLEEVRLLGLEALDLDGTEDNDAWQTDNFGVLAPWVQRLPVDSWSVSPDGSVYVYSGRKLPVEGDVICLSDSGGATALFRVASAAWNGSGMVLATRDGEAALEDFYSMLRVTASCPPVEARWSEQDPSGLETGGTVTVEPFVALRFDGAGLTGKLTLTARAEVDLTAKNALSDVEVSIPLSEEQTLAAEGVPGLTVTLDPMELKLTVAGCQAGEASVSYTVEIGTVFRSGQGVQFVRQAEGSVTKAPEGGFQAALDLTAHGVGDLLGGALSLEAGTETSLKLTVEQAATGVSANGEYDHTCERCLTGNATLELDGFGAGTLRRSGEEPEEQQTRPESVSFRLGEFYHSVLHPDNGLGWGSEPVLGEGACPNRAYRVSISAADLGGNTVTGTTIAVSQEGKPLRQEAGPCAVYLYPGEYTVTASFDTADMTLEVAVRNSPRSVILWEPRGNLGIVVKKEDGQVAPGLTVTVSRDGRTVETATTDEQGVCSIQELPAGAYSVTASTLLYQGTAAVSVSGDGTWSWGDLVLKREADPAPSVLARIEELKEQFPAGKYWNHRGVEVSPGQETWQIVTDRPCSHRACARQEWDNKYYGVTSEVLLSGQAGVQCLGFASMLSDQIFGTDAPIRTFKDFDQLRVGDQIRLLKVGHSMVVIEKGEDYIAVAEANADFCTCKIAWGRVIKRSTMLGYGENVLYMTRYPD